MYDIENSNEEKQKNEYKKFKRTILAAMVCCCVVSLAVGAVGGVAVMSMPDDAAGGGTVSEVSSESGIFESSGNSQNEVIKVDIKTSNGDGDSMSVASVAALVEDSVVAINVSGEQSVQGFGGIKKYTVTSSGSGVIISEDGYIVTNHHVISDAKEVTVILCDGTQYDAKIVASDAKSDLAVLKVEAKGMTPAVFGNSDKTILGEVAIAIGNPLGTFGGSVTTGVISGLNRELLIEGSVMNLLQTDAAVNPGNSGGGLFNSKGELIGIVNAKSTGSDVEGIGFAIPTNDVRAVVDDLISVGYVKGRPAQNFETIDITSTMMAMMYKVSRTGVYIYDIYEGCAEYEAGLRVGDYILTADGYEISAGSEIEYIIGVKEVGDSMAMTILRDGKSIEIIWVIEENIPQELAVA